MSPNTGLLSRVAEKTSVADSVATLVHGISNLLKRAETDTAKGQVTLADEVMSLRKWLTRSSSAIVDAISANTIEKLESVATTSGTAKLSGGRAAAGGKRAKQAPVGSVQVSATSNSSTPATAAQATSAPTYSIPTAKQPKTPRAQKIAGTTPAVSASTADTPKVRSTGKAAKATSAAAKPKGRGKTKTVEANAGEGGAEVARKTPGTRAGLKRAA